MRVAIFTDLPFWCTDTMYLKELEKSMPKIGVFPEIFLIENSRLFKKIDATTGIMKMFNIVKLVKKLSKFDLIHVQFTFPLGFTFAFLSLLRILNKPLVIHTHGYDVFTVPSIGYGLRRNLIGKKFAHYTWNRANKIIANCIRAKTEIENDGIAGNKIDLVYNGVDETLFNKSEIPEELLYIKRDNDLIFLNVASMVPVKNQIRLFKAFRNIMKKYESKYKIKLVVIGNEPMSLSETQNPNVIFLGKKNHGELKYYYSFADAFVLPSLSETNSWSMMEAMSCELPVIASNVGGLGEIIEDEKFLFNPLDLNDISKKIETIIEMSDSERKRIGSSNRKTILKHYTLQRHMLELKKVYESVSS